MEPTHIGDHLAVYSSATMSVTFGIGLNVLRNTGPLTMKFDNGIHGIFHVAPSPGQS